MSNTETTIEDLVRSTYQQWLADYQFKLAVSDASKILLEKQIQDLNVSLAETRQQLQNALSAGQSTDPQDSPSTPIVLD